VVGVCERSFQGRVGPLPHQQQLLHGAQCIERWGAAAGQHLRGVGSMIEAAEGRGMTGARTHGCSCSLWHPRPTHAPQPLPHHLATRQPTAPCASTQAAMLAVSARTLGAAAIVLGWPFSTVCLDRKRAGSLFLPTDSELVHRLRYTCGGWGGGARGQRRRQPVVRGRCCCCCCCSCCRQA